MAVPKFYGTYIFYFGRIAKVLTHIKAMFWGEGYKYLLFLSSIWTRKVVKVMCTRDTHCTTWTPFLTPPVLIRSIYDRHCHSGTEVYLSCILYIYVNTSTKLLTNNRFIGDQIWIKTPHLLYRIKIYISYLHFTCAVFIWTKTDLQKRRCIGA